MHREKLIGQLFTIGFTGLQVDQDLRELVDYIQPGGFVLFKRNVSEPAAIRSLTDALQALPKEFPSFISVDQEGGTVARLRKPFTEFPGNRALLATYLAEKRSTAGAEEQARIFAHELQMVGINWDYAPVLDVDSNPKNPVIGKRSFSSDVDEVCTLGVAFAKALEANNVLSCGKHVPGHGNTSLDSHVDLPVEETSLAILRKREFKPFQAYGEAGLAALMTAHVVYKALDPLFPATLSEIVLQQIVRGEIGFQGMLVTDDMEMKAIDERYGPEDSTIKAVVAGNDIVLICHSPEKQRRAYAALVAEDKKSRVVSRRVDDALGRITKAKKRLVAPPTFSMSSIGADESRRLADKLVHYGSQADAKDPTEYKA
jgi:beta-N-acetylhexosaminidase